MQAVTECVLRWLKEGKIRKAPANCPFNSPILAVPKKDDQGRMTKVRICIDIRAINKWLLENDKFEIPHIPDLLSALAGGKIFGEYDLSEAYFQFKLAAESQQFTAFTWDQQQYVFVGTPFGLKHIPSFFQRYITNLFRDMPFVFPYIDNLGFASTSWEQHHEHARLILERLASVNLRIKPGFYNLGNSHMKLLGHVVSEDGISLDPEKVVMIQKWPLPSEGANLASALGLGAYLRDHIRNYADVTAPLEAVKRQKVIQWTDNLRRHWMLFKRAFANAPILSFPDMGKRFVLATDASQSGVGGILYQPSDDDNTITPHNIVAIASKQLGPAQKNYPVYKKELWAVIYCLRKFHTYLWGRRDVLVLTDHKPLIHILNQRVLSVALQQWLDVLLDYDLTIKYRPGVLHVIPDALSRMYMSTYNDNNIAWGTHSNITILNNFNKSSSPSDFLCAQSLAEAKPLSTIKRRHRDVGSGGGVPTGSSSSNQQPLNPTEVNTDVIRHITATHQLLQARGEVDDGVYPITSIEDAEFNAARPCAPLFAGSDFLSGSACIRQAVSLASPGESSSSRHHHAARVQALIASVVGSSVMEPTPVPVVTLPSASAPASTQAGVSAADQLLLAQERKGRTIPSLAVQRSLLDQAHQKGHYGESAVYYSIERDGYWWPAMREDIKRVIAACADCRKFNAGHHGFHPARSVHASQPGDHYQIDLAQLPASLDGRIFCLVLVDVFTGFIVLRALPDKSATSVAQALWDIFCLIGIPRVLQSDNGTEFVNRVIASLNTLIGVNHRYISEYNPRADGKVERCVRTVKLSIMKLLHGATGYWPLHLPFVQFAYNDKLQSLTGSTAFSLMFGRQPNAARDYSLDPLSDNPRDLEAWKRHQEDIVNLIYPSIAQRALQQQAAYRKRLDQSRGKLVASTTTLSKGTVVYIKDPKYLLNPGMKPSREGTYIGPYTVDSVSSAGTYKLLDDTKVMLDRAVPLDQIKVVQLPATTASPSSSSSSSASAPVNGKDEASDDNIYVVDKILGHREKQGRLQYHIMWKGYGLKDSTWEDEGQLNDTACVEKYYQSISARNTSRRAARVNALRTSAVRIQALATGIISLVS